LFLELAQPDEQGFSRKVYVKDFIGEYAVLRLGNGGDWCRDDGPLGKTYNIERHKTGNAIDYVQLHGYKKNPIAKPIPSKIRDEIIQGHCVVLCTSKVEVDHKDGRRDDPRLADASRVTLEDFQPLSKAANAAKRQHCKACRASDRRFDARRLGFSKGHVRGDEVYRGSCVGCYWHDPYFFCQEIGKGTN